MRELSHLEMDAVSGGFLPLLVIAVAAVVLAGCATTKDPDNGGGNNGDPNDSELPD